MATLHVRNVPDELYESLRRRAREEGRSINAEAIELLRPALTDHPRQTVGEMLEYAERLRAGHQRAPGGQSVTEMIREDRER
jgi:plasmid stability protein